MTSLEQSRKLTILDSIDKSKICNVHLYVNPAEFFHRIIVATFLSSIALLKAFFLFKIGSKNTRTVGICCWGGIFQKLLSTYVFNPPSDWVSQPSNLNRGGGFSSSSCERVWSLISDFLFSRLTLTVNNESASQTLTVESNKHGNPSFSKCSDCSPLKLIYSLILMKNRNKFWL